MTTRFFGGAQALIPIIPLYVHSLGADDVMVGTAAGIFMGVAVILRPFTGWLVDAYETRVLTRANRGAELQGWEQGTAVAMLAAAQLCDVDADSIRLTDYGATLVEELASAGGGLGVG